MTVPRGAEEAALRIWDVPNPKAVLVLVHGLGAHNQRWSFAAEFFLKNSIVSYAPELGCLDDGSGYFRSFFRQIMAARVLAVARYPGKKIFLVGESMGALASFLLACEQPNLFDGLICISAAFRNRLQLALPDYLKICIAGVFDPNRSIKLPFDSSMCTRDIEYRKKMDDDSRERRSSPARLLIEILFAQIRVWCLLRKLRMPTIFLVAGQDSIADASAARDVFNGLIVEDKKLVQYPEMYHALSIDIGKEAVFADIVEWIDGRLR